VGGCCVPAAPFIFTLPGIKMPTKVRFCALCKKDCAAVSFYSHLNSKHPDKLWTAANLDEIKKAVPRNPYTHTITLLVSGERIIFSPTNRRFYWDGLSYSKCQSDLRQSQESREASQVRWTVTLNDILTTHTTPLTSTHTCPTCGQPTPQPDADAHTD
jgi:hypothetical protein